MVESIYFLKPAWCGTPCAGLWPEQGLQPVRKAFAFRRWFVTFIRMILTRRFISGYINHMPFTVFHQLRKITNGRQSEVAHFLKDVPQGGDFLVFDDSTGRQVDLDLRAPLSDGPTSYSEETAEPRGRGRPRLGVVP